MPSQERPWWPCPGSARRLGPVHGPQHPRLGVGVGAGVATLPPPLGGGPSSGATRWGVGRSGGPPTRPTPDTSEVDFSASCTGTRRGERRARVSVATLGLQSSCKRVLGCFFFQAQFLLRLATFREEVGGGGAARPSLHSAGLGRLGGVGAFPGCTAAGFGAPRRAHSPRLPRVPEASAAARSPPSSSPPAPRGPR